MADAIPFFVEENGAPLVGAVGSFVATAFARSGAVRTPPTVSELGGGRYQIAPSDSDENEGTVVLVDCGAGRLPRRISFAVFRPDRSNQFWAFHLEDPTGALWGGAPPTIPAGGYSDRSGALRSPPALQAVAGAYLWAAAPTPDDVAADVSVRFDAPAGASARFFVGGTELPGSAPGGLASGYRPRRTGLFLRSSSATLRRLT